MYTKYVNTLTSFRTTKKYSRKHTKSEYCSIFPNLCADVDSGVLSVCLQQYKYTLKQP